MIHITSKPWYKSSTIWINLAGIIALGLTFVVNTGFTQDKDIITLLLAVVNIINRWRSTISPVTLTK